MISEILYIHQKTGVEQKNNSNRLTIRIDQNRIEYIFSALTICMAFG